MKRAFTVTVAASHFPTPPVLQCKCLQKITREVRGRCQMYSAGEQKRSLTNISTMNNNYNLLSSGCVTKRFPWYPKLHCGDYLSLFYRRTLDKQHSWNITHNPNNSGMVKHPQVTGSSSFIYCWASKNGFRTATNDYSHDQLICRSFSTFISLLSGP